MKQNLEYYQNLAVKSFNHEISDSEKTILNHWIQESNENKNLFNDFEAIWKTTEFSQQIVMPDINDEWEKLSNSLEFTRETNITKRQSTIGFGSLIENIFGKGWKPALTAFSIVAIIITTVFISEKNSIVPQLKQLETANKEKIELTLQDGSIVKLNSGSKIEYMEPFNADHREITLRGEAYFVVTKDSRPFTVITEGARTTVLGTQFNVWARDNKTNVIVKEGLVNLAPAANDSEGINLPGNFSGTVSEGELSSEPQKVDANNLLGWLENKLVFEKTPLSDLTKELVRYYDVSVAIDDTSLSSLSITGTFEDKKIEDILEMISLTLDIKVKKDNGGYILY